MQKVKKLLPKFFLIAFFCLAGLNSFAGGKTDSLPAPETTPVKSEILTLAPGEAMTFHLDAELSGPGQVEVRDLEGALIFSTQVDLSGEDSLRFAIGELRGGMYSLSILVGNEELSQRFLVSAR